MTKPLKTLAFALAPLVLLVGAIEAVGSRVLPPSEYESPLRLFRGPAWTLGIVPHEADGQWVHKERIRLSPDGDGFPVEYHLNRHSLRGPDFEWNAAPNVRRVVALGDSVLYGWGTTEGATYDELLRRRLGERDDGPWEVINAAFSGMTSTQVLGRWRDKVHALGPEFVLVGVCANDGASPHRLVGPDALPLTDAELIRAIDAHRDSPIVRWVQARPTTRLLASVVNPLRTRWRERDEASNELFRVPPDEFERNLRTLIAEIRDAGAEVLLVESGCQPPHLARLRQFVGEGVPYLSLESVCAMRRAKLAMKEPYASLSRYYEQELGLDIYGANAGDPCTIDGAHFSRLGHYVFAEHVYGWITSGGPHGLPDDPLAFPFEGHVIEVQGVRGAAGGGPGVLIRLQSTEHVAFDVGEGARIRRRGRPAGILDLRPGDRVRGTYHAEPGALERTIVMLDATYPGRD